MVKKPLFWTTIITLLALLVGCGPSATEVAAPPTEVAPPPTPTEAPPPTDTPQPEPTQAPTEAAPLLTDTPQPEPTEAPPEAAPPATDTPQPEPTQPPAPAIKRVVFIIAHEGFRDEEYTEPRAVLEARGVQVTVASSSPETAMGMMGATVQPDVLVSDIVVSDYGAIVFIGGPGAAEYWDDPTAHRIAQEAVAQGKVLAAICIAPVALARAGVLQGRQATVFESAIGEVEAGGATCTGESVVRDGLIVTANGPGAARQFGEAIAAALEEQG
jgi:protease I